ncbi:hypothetical protein FBUS_05675 [Fasciolopsis buskii]|uniref:Uncharacterized protein n=1 Tax=Fasciolopsis buskii TaxID=27845 RepID=A0A8E0VLJ3_9TREM|nr:hypothetical protein FBUS_05675 [Fasciolopsis buski]
MPEKSEIGGHVPAGSGSPFRTNSPPQSESNVRQQLQPQSEQHPGYVPSSVALEHYPEPNAPNEAVAAFV